MSSKEPEEFSLAWWNNYLRKMYKRKIGREDELDVLAEFAVQIMLRERSKFLGILDPIQQDDGSITIRGVVFSPEQLDTLCLQLVGKPLLAKETVRAENQTAVPAVPVG